MRAEGLDSSDRRRAVAAQAEVAGDGSACPESGGLLDSAREELVGAENEAILLHLGECTACAAMWRLAKDLCGASPEPAVLPAPMEDHPRPFARRRALVLTAAAALVLAVGFALFVALPERQADQAVYRAPEERWLDSALPSDVALPRENCLLR